MRRILFILAALLFLAGTAAHAQTVKASNYSTLGCLLFLFPLINDRNQASK